MEWLLIVAGIILVWVAYKFGFSSHRIDAHESIAAKWTEEQAQAVYLESYSVVYAQMVDPAGSGIKFKTSMEYVERATAAANRLNELRGDEHGPAFRRRFRGQFVKNVMADIEKWSRQDPFAPDF